MMQHRLRFTSTLKFKDQCKDDINSETSLSEHIAILLATPNIVPQDFLRCLINTCSGMYLIAVDS